MEIESIAVPSNLISDSPLVRETFDLVRSAGGRLPVVAVAEQILKFRQIDEDIAAILVADLVRDDNRFKIRDTAMLELKSSDDDARLLDDDFVVVDVEATSTKLPPGRIVEIAARKISKGRIIENFETLVNPEVSIPPFITRLTGISDAMVRNAPLFADVAGEWLDFAGDAVLVAHNAIFDITVINHEIARLFPGCRMANQDLCTVKLSRKIVPGLTSYRLHKVAEHFSVEMARWHRAGSDATATAEIFVQMIRRLQKIGINDMAGARLMAM